MGLKAPAPSVGGLILPARPTRCFPAICSWLGRSQVRFLARPLIPAKRAGMN
jgi:hypothetical protein